MPALHNNDVTVT